MSTLGYFGMLVVFSAGLKPLAAATTVSGAIANQIWTKANSPYNVVGNVAVASLTIQPGVTVLFAGDFVFEIDGGIHAIGSADEPIVFTQSTGLSGWQGIVFNQNALDSALGFCRIERSHNSGIRLLSSSPTITNCVIANNSGILGGGIYATNNQPVTISKCVITNNAATGLEGGGVYLNVPSANLLACYIGFNQAPRMGAGVRFYRFDLGTLNIFDCTITSNSMSGNQQAFGAGVAFYGGRTGTLRIQRSKINGNSATPYSEAQGVGVYFNGSGIINNCIFDQNSSSRIGVGGISADCSVLGNQFMMTNCVISNNKGGGLLLLSADSTSSQIVNCTFAYNSTNGGLSGGGANVMNSIFWGNSPTQVQGGATLSYSDVQGGFPGLGNIAVNPVFSSLVDFTILDASPCVDAGNPDPSFNDVCFPPSLGTMRNDMGAYGGPGPCSLTPRILVQPQNVVTCLGQSPTFVVEADGSAPLSFQWRFNGNLLNGATSKSLPLVNVSTNDAGSYSVDVFNEFGRLTSDPASLLVMPTCLTIDLHAGLNVVGQVGQTFRIEYSSRLLGTNNWILITNISLSSPYMLWMDPQPAYDPKKFYRLIPAP